MAVEPTGLPYNVIITDISINGVEAIEGTYVQLYDGSLCVGTALYQTSANTLVVTWQGDPSQNILGFAVGNTITAKIYTEWYSKVQIFDAALSFERGNGTFGNDAFSVAKH
ncbi:MAG: hypothetical protein HC896_01060 [Bacteroidales bacterium]|nr:hypothetical protein [Bacteroidales bacterium]